MNSIISKKWFLLVSGLICGIGAALLAFLGNPGNMAICIACFIRDTAGALKLHQAEAVQYVRPEIIGIVAGSFIISLATKEFKSKSGSSPMIRFLLGMMMVIGALVFLGCPLRMVIRMSAGDLNAWIALIGFIAGIGCGCFALKKGFSLGKSENANVTGAVVMPSIMIVVLILSVCTGLFVSSVSGPGSMHAPVIASLLVGLVFGAFAQKSRMCFAGSIRDIFLMKNFDLILIICGLFIPMLIYNIATGNFNLSMVGNPIAHRQTLWNILGMFVVGFGAVLAGGCPLRQLVLTGQGSQDAAVTVLGMFAGGALSHNLMLASSADSVNAETGEKIIGVASQNGKIAIIICIVILILIAFVGNKNKTSKESK